MYTLDGRQKKALHAALLRAFPRHSALERLVEFQLDAHLAVVAGEGPLAEVAFRLIEWAEAQGRIEALVNGAREANPNNPDLLAFERMVAGPRDARPPEVPRYRPGIRGRLALVGVALVLGMAIWRPSLPGMQRPPGGRAPDVVPATGTAAATHTRRAVREEVLAFTWTRIDGRGACESDGAQQRVMYRGESSGSWPVNDSQRARDVQVVVVQDVQIETASISMRGDREAATVSLPRRDVVRKWSFGQRVEAPVVILICARVRPGTPPSSPFRVNTWKEIS